MQRIIRPQAQPLTIPLAQPVDKGLVLYMPFQEGSGNFTADLSGRGNHGILVGPTWVSAAGKKGFAVDFDGSNNINCGDSISLRPANAITVEGWIRRTRTGVTENFAAKFGAGSDGYRLGVAPADKPRFSVVDNSGATFHTQIFTSVADLNWHHLAGIWDGANIYVFLDGVKSSGVAVSSLKYNISRNLLIGTSLDGQIALVRIHSRVLSDDEIRRHYERGL